MKVRFNEDPKAWRKSTLLSVLALLVLSSVCRWRHVLPASSWHTALVALGIVAGCAWIRPQWFRGYYRFSTWAGFWSSQWVARVVLALMFLVLIVPAGLIMRLLGKDPLRLKRSPNAASYWTPAKETGSLDRLF